MHVEIKRASKGGVTTSSSEQGFKSKSTEEECPADPQLGTAWKVGDMKETQTWRAQDGTGDKSRTVRTEQLLCPWTRSPAPARPLQQHLPLSRPRRVKAPCSFQGHSFPVDDVMDGVSQ